MYIYIYMYIFGPWVSRGPILSPAPQERGRLANNTNNRNDNDNNNDKQQ